MEFKDAKTKTRIFSSLITLLVVGLLIFAGPAQAFVVSLGDFNEDNKALFGDVVSTIATLSIDSNERIDVGSVSLSIDGVTRCAFNAYNPSQTQGNCDGITISTISVPTGSNNPGYGYGYGYGYNYGYGYGYGYTDGDFVYNISIDTSVVGTPGTDYVIGLTTQLGNQVYSSNKTLTILATIPAFEDIGFLLPPGESNMSNIPNVTTDSDWFINESQFEVFVPTGTTISGANGTNIDATAIQSALANLSELSGISGLAGALQFGIVDFGLEFSQPITIKINVGTEYNGQTLNVLRSKNGTSDWNNDGIVDPKTCLVALGVCEFSTTKASYFAATEPTTTTTTSSSTGSSGYCTTEWTVSEWSACTNGVQTRTVSYPANFCTPTAAKPTETQSCTVSGQDSEDTETTETPDRNSLFTGFVIGEFLSKPTNIVGLLVVLVLIVLAFLFVAKKRKSSVKGKGKKEKEAVEDEE